MKTLYAAALAIIIIASSCKKEIHANNTLQSATADRVDIQTVHLLVPERFSINDIDPATHSTNILNDFYVNAGGISQTPVYYNNNLILLAGEELVSKTFPDAALNWSSILSVHEGFYGASPLCLGGSTVFLYMGFQTHARTRSQQFFAVNATTGEIIWKRVIKNDPATGPYYQSSFSSPTYANGIVYFPAADTMYAFNAQTGAINWRFATHRSSSNFFSHQRNPVVSNGALFFTTGVAGFSGDDSLFAIKANNGSLLWKKAFNIGTAGAPLVKNDKLYIDGQDGVYCINPSNGSLIWRHRLRRPACPVFVTDTTVYVTDEMHVNALALDASTGTLKWTTSIAENVFDNLIDDGPIAADGLVFMSIPYSFYEGLNTADGTHGMRATVPIYVATEDRIPPLYIGADNLPIYTSESGMY